MKIKNMNNAGTTLVELMVYMIVGLIVITGAFKIISNATGSYVHGRAVSKAQYNARDGVASMSRDIASMGFKTYFDGNTMKIDSVGFGLINVSSYKAINKNATNFLQLKGYRAAFFYYPGSIDANGNQVGDTLEFFRIKIDKDGQREKREKVMYYLDAGNVLTRELFDLNTATSSQEEWVLSDKTIIASNVVALKFRFGITGNDDWFVLESPESAAQDIANNKDDIRRSKVRNVEISMLVKGTENKKGTGTYGAAEYDVGGYIYHTPSEDLQIVHRLYQQAVEVPNNGIVLD